MKRFFLGFLYLLIGIWPQALRGDSSTAEKLSEIIQKNFLFGEGFSNVAREVVERTMYYDTLISNQLPQGRGLTIDMIFQAHVAPYEDLSATNINSVQENIFQLLLNSHYPIIGMEGNSCERVSRDCLIRHSLECSKLLGISLSDSEVSELIDQSIPFDAGIRYALSHPSVLVIGTEDNYLNVLNFMTMGGLKYKEVSSNDPYVKLVNLMLRLRSEIALAKIIRSLRLNNATVGVLIIGSLHKYDIIRLLLKNGIHYTTIYEAP